MDDYVKREDVLNTSCSLCGERPCAFHDFCGRRAAFKMIRAADVVNVVEIVRCKDCEYMVGDSWCCWHDSRMREDDFCSRGKRKA